MQCYFRNSTRALLLSKCQHNPIGKFLPLNQNSVSKSCVQVCFLSSVNTAMQYEKAVLSHAVKVWGERRGQEEPSGCLGDNEGVGAVMLFLKILQFLKIQLQLLE